MKDRRIFSQSQMNLDTDLRNVPPNHYGLALNIIANNQGESNLGCIENRKGNTLISFAFPNVSNFTVIGTAKDTKNKAIIYFVHSDQNSHCILRYNVDSNTIDKILWGEPLLNFRLDHPITSANVVDGKLLYWTDGYFEKFTYDPLSGEFKDIGFNGPRKLNMDKAYNMTNGIVVAPLYKYSLITEEILDRIKYPPYHVPGAGYTTDTSVYFNFLTKELFQFAYAYQYDDNEISVLSPMSSVAYPSGSINLIGHPNPSMPQYNNAINVSFETGSEIVKDILLYVRTNNNGDWYLFKTVKKYNADGVIILNSNISSSVLFYNNEAMTPVDQSDISRPFDYVGQIVKSQEIIKDNRIVDGGITENYDNCDINVLLRHAVTPGISLAGIEHYVGYIGPLAPTLITTWDFTTTGIVGDTYQVYFEIYDPTAGAIANTYVFTNTVLATDGTWPNVFLGRFTDIITAGLPTGGYANWIYIIGTTYRLSVFIPAVSYPAGSYIQNSRMTKFRQDSVAPSWKEGFMKYFGIRYYDRAGRQGAINISTNTKIYIPFVTETGFAGLAENYKNINLITWEIYHKPPEWAVTYEWCYALQVPTFLQYYYTSGVIDSSGSIRLNVNDRIALLRNTTPDSDVPLYTFTEGDRIRFIGKGKFAQPQYIWYYPNVIDTEIIGLDAATLELIINDIAHEEIKLPSTVNAGFDFIVCEIYTPRKTTDESIYHAISHKYNILSPHTDNRAHGPGYNGVAQTYSNTIIDIPILQVGLWLNVVTGQYHIFFTISTADYHSVPGYATFFQDGTSLTLLGFTDPLSVFLNGTHTEYQGAASSGAIIGAIDLYLYDAAVYPALTDPEYDFYFPEDGGYLHIVLPPSPATGQMENGDVYIRGRYTVEPPVLPVEASAANDFFSSTAISIGAPGLVVSNMKRLTRSCLRYGGIYLEDSKVNNLSKFLYLDQEELPNEFGSIYVVRELGDTLKVLQARKNTSFFINKSMLSTATGGMIPVEAQTKVLSLIMSSALDYGCQNPESVVTSDRYAYWWDYNYGYAIRDDANGMDAISDRGVKSWFETKKRQILGAGSYRVITGVNKKNDEIWYTFIIVPSASASDSLSTIETIVWNERYNCWTTILQYDLNNVPPDCYGNLGDTMVSFLRGQLWLENSNLLYNNFFGTQKPMSIEVISNYDQEKVKIFNELGLSTTANDGSWGAQLDIPATDIVPSGQQTIILPHRFKTQEEAIYADIPRNKLTPMAGTDEYKMLNGDRMRGMAIKAKLSNLSSNKVTLYSVIFKFIPSEISK